MSSVPKVPPETMKKVAATRGHKVSRTNCCFWGFAGGVIFSETICGFQAGELVAVANFDVDLPSDRLSPPQPLPPRFLVPATSGNSDSRDSGSWFANSRIQLFGCCAKRIFRKFFAEGQWPEVTGSHRLSAIGSRQRDIGG